MTAGAAGRHRVMNIGTVLCPIDLSELAERELELAVQVCETFGARLVLHHNLSAISPALSKSWEWDQAHCEEEPSAQEAEKRLAELMRQLPRTVRAEAAITHGPLSAVVPALAEQLPADLLVIGTHGWSTADHASLTETILERARCPVLTIRDGIALQAFRLRPDPGTNAIRVLVPTDFSQAATTAVAYAIELARQLPIELHLAHVCAAPVADKALESLAELVPPELKWRAMCHVRTGRTFEEISELLRQIRPAFVVMGTHARDF